MVIERIRHCMINEFFLTLMVLSLAIPMYSMADTGSPSSNATLLASNDQAKSQDPVPEKDLVGYQNQLTLAVSQAFKVLTTILKDDQLTEEQKQLKAINYLRHLRWGPERKDYFFITDLQGTILLDPYLPNLEGKNLLQLKDQNDKEVFADMIKLVNEQGQGFVNFQWPRYEGKKPVPKVAFVRAFQPWGWVVGSGVYIDTIEAYEPPEPLFFNPLQERPIEDHESPSKV